MAYFSNGTEGALYQEEYCDRCIHRDDCAVWDAHLAFNYRECNNKDSILHFLIPRTESGLSNGECRMFKGAPSAGQEVA